MKKCSPYGSCVVIVFLKYITLVFLLSLLTGCSESDEDIRIEKERREEQEKYEYYQQEEEERIQRQYIEWGEEEQRNRR